MRDNDRVLSDGEPSANLKERSVRSGFAVLATQFGRFVLQMVQLLVLARLLAPASFGLVALAAVFVTPLKQLENLGLATATITSKTVTHAQLSTLFWINLALSLALALLVGSVAPVIGWCYEDARLTYIVLGFSTVFLFTGLAVQHQALLRRQMRFGALGAIRVVSLTIAICMAILGAWKGIGYWALVLLQIVNALCVAVGAWLITRWKPGLPSKTCGATRLVKTGLDVTVFNLVNQFVQYSDRLLLGRFVVPSEIGFYDRAWRLGQLPRRYLRKPVNSVSMPALVRLGSEPKRFKHAYAEMLALLAFVTMPLAALCCVCAEQVISAVLGQKWLDSAPILRILAIGVFLHAIQGTAGTVMLALRQSRKYLKLGLARSLGLLLFFLLAAPWGTEAVAAAYSTYIWVSFVPFVWCAFRSSPVSMTVFFRALWRPMVTSVVAAVLVLFFRPYLSGFSQPWSFLACSTFFLATYLLLYRAMPGGSRALSKYASYVRIARFKRKA